MPQRIPLDKLYAWRPKLEETLAEVRAGKLSFSTGQPLRVTRLDSPRGAFFVLDGHHRAVEAVLAGKSDILAEIDPQMPRIERTGGAHRDVVAAKANVAAFVLGAASAAESRYDAAMSASPTVAPIPVAVTVVAEAGEAYEEADKGPDCGCMTVKDPAGLTVKQVHAQLAQHGIVLRKKNEFGDFRVNFRGGDEATAYYTTDLDDALATGLAMAKSRAPAAAAPIPAGLHEGGEALEEAARFDNQPLETEAYAHRAGLPRGHAGIMWVANLPGHGGVDWGYTQDPKQALLISPHWQRRFKNDMYRVGSDAIFVAPTASGARDVGANDYDGWKNRETWTVNVWSSNDPAIYRLVIDHPEAFTAHSAMALARRHLPREGEVAFLGTQQAWSKIDWNEIAQQWNVKRADARNSNRGLNEAPLPSPPDPTGGYALMQRMMDFYVRQRGFGRYVPNSAVPTGKRAADGSGVWMFYARRETGMRQFPRREAPTQHEVDDSTLRRIYAERGVSEAGEATSEASAEAPGGEAYSQAMQWGLGTVGHNRHFTARELAEYLRISPNQARSRLNTLTRSGYVGLDDDGYFVTRQGWTWIEGAAQTWDQAKRGAHGQEAAEIVGEASEYGVTWQQRRDGVWMARGTGGIYYMMPTPSGQFRAIWMGDAGNQEDLGTDSWAAGAQAVARHVPNVGRLRQLAPERAAEAGEAGELHWERSGGGTGWRTTGPSGQTYLLRQAGGGRWNVHVNGQQYSYGSLDEAKAAVEHSERLRMNESSEAGEAQDPVRHRAIDRAWNALSQGSIHATTLKRAVSLPGEFRYDAYVDGSDVPVAIVNVHPDRATIQLAGQQTRHFAGGYAVEAAPASTATEAGGGLDYDVAYFDPSINQWRSRPVHLNVAPEAVHREAARVLKLETGNIVVTKRQPYGTEAGELAAEADWDIHIYDPATKKARTERLYVPNTRPDMGDTNAAAAAASRRFHVRQEYILALPHRERSLVNVSEAAASDAMPHVPEGQVCRPWVRMEKDPVAYNACMALAEKIGPIEGHDRLYEIVRQQMEREDVEAYWAILFDTHMGLRAMSEISRGSRDRVQTPMADLARVALYQAVHYGAMGLAVAHSHPSGKAKPSHADGEVTKAVEDGCAAMGLVFIDHIVVGSRQYYSFRAKKTFKVKV